MTEIVGEIAQPKRQNHYSCHQKQNKGHKERCLRYPVITGAERQHTRDERQHAKRISPGGVKHNEVTRPLLLCYCPTGASFRSFNFLDTDFGGTEWSLLRERGIPSK